IIHRRSLTANMRSRYKAAGFVIYDEIKGEIDLRKHKRVLIQYESLHRLNTAGDPVNLLICDEINSICMQYLSKIGVNNRRITEYMLESIFRSAERSIMLDGGLNDKIVNAINCIGQREYFIWNNEPETLLSPNVILSCEESAFKAEIIKKLAAGSKVEVVTACGPNYCETLATLIREKLPVVKLQTIHSETDDR